MGCENALSADNQQGTQVNNLGHLRDYKPNSFSQNKHIGLTRAYLLGAIHDGTFSKYTIRISQKDKAYPELIRSGLQCLGFRSWVYKEGEARNVYVVEFSKKILNGYSLKSNKDKVDYVRGYFDSEGSVPRNSKSRFYIYFCQKDLNDLNALRTMLIDLGISCGKIHNPSWKVDPDYWRFFVLTKSHREFSILIGSYHPDKSKILCERMKI